MATLKISTGSRVFYEISGPETGPPVMLLHGWCSSGRLYSKQAPELAAAGYRVHVIDNVGHGRSSKRVDSVVLEELLSHFDEIANAFGLYERPFALVGHSAGGGAAQQIYLAHPEKIACLVLLNTGFLMRDNLFRKIFWTFSPPMVELLFSPLVKLAVRPAINAGADLSAAAFGIDPHEVRLWFSDIMRTRGRTARLEIEEIMRHNTKDTLPRINCPTLIIGGSFDLLAPARQSRAMHDLIPDSELHILPTGHTGKMFMYEKVNSLLLDFLERHYPADIQ